ncbi:MAG: lysophospholipid acyltransferase family protein [Gemmatimonadaceae bacterium]|nr:lysophospholipid acyltransferase family protein [Gemmatimonadaceae bacterium]
MSAPRGGWRQRLKIVIASALGYLLIRALGSSWRVRFVPDGARARSFVPGHGCVLATWHGVLLPVVYTHGDVGMLGMISQHGDGEIIARIAKRLGIDGARGSSSRGGGAALRAMIEALEQDRVLGFTPDGPRGPARAFQPGALIASQRTGRPVLPVGVAVDRAWIFRSWDRFTLPKPFARVVIAYGPLTAMSPGDRVAEADQQRFAALIDDATRTAEAALA